MFFDYFIGIDPGITGGITILNKDGKIIMCLLVPLREDGTIDTQKIIDEYPLKVTNAYLLTEKVWSYSKQGVTSSFNFGKSTGHLIGVMESITGLQTHEVAACTWQRALIDTTKDSKVAAREFCKTKWPEYNFLKSKRSKIPSSGMCDSACISYYAMKYNHLLGE